MSGANQGRCSSLNGISTTSNTQLRILCIIGEPGNPFWCDYWAIGNYHLKTSIMTPINDKHGTVVAYLYNNIILDTDSETVVGVVLGNCVFGDAEQPIGKYFNNTFRAINGKMIAVTSITKKANIKINELKVLDGAWRILKKVREHVCGWIQEAEEWADMTFSEFLGAKKTGNISLAN